ncbi:MAG: hypothetical protein CL786_04535 [Chloroflexi bacterium]|nr:hypothetical protein [Chloroflexota bacterium]|tara:strand:- start:226 stop:609 length:384 start_codon:yes stop_codon:yes gene_type:complete
MGFLRRIKRYIFIFLGLLFLALGIVGFIVPGLPGTIWLIVAATFFVRSSEKLYNFVVQNKYFGETVRDFLETGSMALKAKVFSLGSMWVFTGISIIWAPYGWLFFKIPVLSLALVGTIYILSRPTKN